MAFAQHDDGGQRRLPRFPLRNQGGTRSGLCSPAPAACRRRALERRACTRNRSVGGGGGDRKSCKVIWGLFDGINRPLSERSDLGCKLNRPHVTKKLRSSAVDRARSGARSLMPSSKRVCGRSLWTFRDRVRSGDGSSAISGKKILSRAQLSLFTKQNEGSISSSMRPAFRAIRCFGR